jgi:hypothetical protein
MVEPFGEVEPGQNVDLGSGSLNSELQVLKGSFYPSITE